MSICAVVFDLDDTLYLEREYIRSGCRHVAGDLSSDPAKRRELFDYLMDTFQGDDPERTFDRLYDEFPGLCNGRSAKDLAEFYHAHSPDIHLMPRIGSLIRDLRTRGVRLGIIADGPPVAQRKKIEALGLADSLDAVVLTESWGPEYRKPHERAFRHVTSEFALRPEEFVYVADDPEKDFRAPNALGWRTVRLRLPYQSGFAREHANQEDKPSLVISDIRALQAFLEETCTV